MVPRVATGRLLAAALVAAACAPAIAADFRSVADAAVVLYDAPSLKAKPLYILGHDTPLEVIVPVEGWVKVRDADGTFGWVERKGLPTGACWSCARLLPKCARAPTKRRALVFRAEPGVLLELGEPVTSAAAASVPGWVKVKHAGRANRIRPDHAGVRDLSRCVRARRRTVDAPARPPPFDEDVDRHARRRCVGHGARRASRAACRHRVTLWARDAAQATLLAAARSNERYLPGVAFPDALRVTAALAEAAGADLLDRGDPGRGTAGRRGAPREHSARSARSSGCRRESCRFRRPRIFPQARRSRIR